MQRTIVALFAMVALAAPAVRAQDGSAVLKAALAKYQTPSVFVFEGAVSVTTEGSPRDTRTPFAVAFAGPANYRWATLPGSPRERVVARTGGTIVSYYAILGQYLESPAEGQTSPPPGSLTALLVGQSAGSVPGLWPIPDGAEVALSAERHEGRLVQVVTVTAEKSTALCRIDPATGLVVSIERRDQVPSGDKTVVRTTIETYRYLPGDASRAQFMPPAGAKKVEQIAPEPADLTGKPAPDFRLLTATGDFLELKALRGRVVMLNFWAPW